jgi:hypothetical protein
MYKHFTKMTSCFIVRNIFFVFSKNSQILGSKKIQFLINDTDLTLDCELTNYDLHKNLLNDIHDHSLCHLHTVEAALCDHFVTERN